MASSFGFSAAVNASAKNSAFIAGRPDICLLSLRVGLRRRVVQPRRWALVGGNAFNDRVLSPDPLEFG